MDPKSKERLDQILEKNPKSLTQDEIDFLRARRSYLKDSIYEEYEVVLKSVEKRGGGLKVYLDLMNKAKSLGYSGKRISTEKLELFVREHTT
jgi:predicted Zn-ribbon and HTH transcriptional regulator